ncbi:MAG: hypothetical protein EAZ39_09340 [Oscillatoriales cyanobacterium]|nr:MAG: hypothetical protein EAZ86_09665 [Oscillatoriales cyanobacterium]TAF98261.1 MAG: hypothetical protein EAZ45_20830 [Oscillatoriales cyanobacterium]TAG19397.1 MAG: hypothetical protein EAZ39_09340 [Oscillatoriales cyanobacterium]TAG40648.1 MAG: hypothetical protein EAZ33_17560 [Oscillatoriales cyanobacterium]TAG66198.1 MAG: hypothetical protein EAZ25_12945 [Oscillatoriales cyanobacterium]
MFFVCRQILEILLKKWLTSCKIFYESQFLPTFARCNRTPALAIALNSNSVLKRLIFNIQSPVDYYTLSAYCF